ncbi:Uma2 family endonuclease [filamentous cyanobacterium LEGE 11480]|uniref:Uma2 family endonuclease n=1 Tax=Romeriopsis navalis LEGE 11480 TaxID=2777977 RepID=A0A928VMJ0_9CYAN|nr:Uma2 family endonuclease [Romeriopsis navalis]MBE9028599.1 Uma2 family endonuclease [Romeriopsis navalis LEGE 11480]
MVMLQFRQLVVQPGQRIQLQDVDWAEFEAILAELGDERSSRIAYFGDVLEIRMPLPEHEVDNELIGDLVKILLEELDIDNECFGSTTFRRQGMQAGIEPDQCFYIENHAVMIGKRRIDLTIDPPPDLAIEVDVTSKTGLEAYQALGVPELWRFEEGGLRISLLQDGAYQDATQSRHFPQFDVIDWVAQVIVRSQTDGRSQTLKAFRKQIRGLIAATN